MITQLLRELQDTWGYDTEELNDIREKLEEVAFASFREGYNEAISLGEFEPCIEKFAVYGKKEDFE